MDTIIDKLFTHYLSEQTVTANPAYSALAKSAVQKEQELRRNLTPEQTACFEQLFEITSQIHFLEVKDAFASACKIGAEASKGFII